MTLTQELKTKHAELKAKHGRIAAAMAAVDKTEKKLESMRTAHAKKCDGLLKLRALKGPQCPKYNAESAKVKAERPEIEKARLDFDDAVRALPQVSQNEFEMLAMPLFNAIFEAVKANVAQRLMPLYPNEADAKYYAGRAAPVNSLLHRIQRTRDEFNVRATTLADIRYRFSVIRELLKSEPDFFTFWGLHNPTKS